ncbi:MAG: hypothetical protein EPN39_02945 [Chitinophagaceae bacterium]|nr:MAG: hypothetical protein EPN39_02945 [Chitinophagaceae bacterium]
MQRRHFLKSSGLLTAGLYALRFPAVAGPFLPSEFKPGIAPPEKKLDPSWIESMMKRGEPMLYRKSKGELKYIGMPVGGITTGTVYLGGDGKLWLWDIFNVNQPGIIPKTLEYEGTRLTYSSGVDYVDPNLAWSPFYQETAIAIFDKGKQLIKKLSADDPSWNEITFSGSYPIGVVKYMADDFPVNVTLEAYSPFIPLEPDDSGLPVTVLSYTVNNLTDRHIEVALGSVMQNSCPLTLEKEESGKRTNTLVQNDQMKGVFFEYHPLEEKYKKNSQYGNMCLSVFGIEDAVNLADLDNGLSPDVLFDSQRMESLVNIASGPASALLIGGVRKQLKIPPKGEGKVVFFISWHFPNTTLPVRDSQSGNYYARRFSNSWNTAQHVSANLERLSALTHVWRNTWYDSTLPYWFLDRSFANSSSLATGTAHRFGTGRFWGWEGVGCCEGTCTHVWSYAQAMARIFPSLERDTRERVDLGLAFDEKTGMISYRGEGTGQATDGQAGTILRIYREHQMSVDNSFLERNWQNIKKAIQFLLNHDSNKDGIIDGAQPNTLDAAWYGEIAWISSLCLAAWRAGEEMANDMGDRDFALTCRNRFLIGKKNVDNLLFNGEYFIQIPDPLLPNRPLGSYKTCEIDQVLGQSWAWQVGLGRILDQQKTLSALKSLWKYNYTPDVGPYIRNHRGGRPYALAGEGGMLMDTNPHHEPNPYGDDITWQAGYFNECMTGFEHQVASHMIAEGMLEKGMVVTRAIHDRYHAARRNPYNEIECSDHYARAMASYGSFITICGFTYHGPKGYIGFAPRFHPENFKAAFTAAEGWGTYSQLRSENKISAKLKLKYGKLSLNKVFLELHKGHNAKGAKVTIDGKHIPSSIIQNESNCEIKLVNNIIIHEEQELSIVIG